LRCKSLVDSRPNLILSRSANPLTELNVFSWIRMQASQSATGSPTQHDSTANPDPAEFEASVETWEESGSEVTGSAVSGSSAWTDDNSTPADRTSRRALILQMARARMKNNKESPTKQKIGPIEEEDGNKTVATDGHTADFDLTGDLD
jgi:hypothetical protein